MRIKVSRISSRKSSVSRTFAGRSDRVSKIQQKEAFWGRDYGEDWDKQRKLALIRDGYACRKCGYKPSKFNRNELSVHHRLPRSKGGRNNLENLITYCQDCHQTQHKHDISGGRNKRR